MEQGVVKSETVSGRSVQTRGFTGVRLLRWAALSMLLVVILLPRALPFSPTFLTFDEITIGNWTSEMTRALLARDWPNTINNAYPAVTLMWIEAGQVGAAQLAPGWTKTAEEMLADSEENTFAALPRRRLALALINTMLVAVAYGLLRRLYNNFVAVIATLLIALDPFLLIQSRVFRTEGLTTELMLVSALMIVLYARERREGWLIGSGIVAGLAMLTKITSLYLLPYTGLVLLAWPLLMGERRWGRLVGGVARDVVLWSGVMVATLFILWPVLWVAPSAAFLKIYHYLAGVSTGIGTIWGGIMFYQGQLITTDPGISFYLWSVAFRTTPVVWLGLLAALAAGLVMLTRFFYAKRLAASLPARVPPIPVDFSVITLLMLAYAVFYFIAMSLGAGKVDRYLLPIFPGLAIVAGAGLAWLASFFSLQRGWRNQGAIWAMVLLGSAWFSLPHHPYYFTYWNPLLGGGRAAVKMLPAGSGEGVDVLIDYLNSLPNAPEIQLFKMTSIISPYCAFVFVGDCLDLSEFLMSDYLITDIFSQQRRRPLTNIQEIIPNADLVRTFNKNGVDYAQLYKMPAGLQFVQQWLDEHGRLEGYSLPPAEVGAGDTLEVRIFWLNGDEGWTLNDSEFFVRVRDEGGHVYQAAPGVLKDSLDLYDDRGPVLMFAAPLRLPVDMAIGEYELEIGLRLKESGEETWQFPLEGPGNQITVKRGILPGSGEEVTVPHRVAEAIEGSGLKLLGYEVGEQGLNLYWQREGAVAEEYRYRLVLKDRQGQVVGWWSDRVGPGLHPLAEWQEGEVVKVPMVLETGRGLGNGRYEGELEVLGASGQVKKRIELGEIAGGWAAAERVVRTGLEPVGFGEGLELIGYEVEGRGSGAGGELVVRLNWLNRGAVVGEVRVVMLGAVGEVLGEGVQAVPERGGLLTWQGVSEHRFELGGLPDQMEIQVRASGSEEWVEVEVAGEGASDRLVIDEVLSKTIIVQP